MNDKTIDDIYWQDGDLSQVKEDLKLLFKEVIDEVIGEFEAEQIVREFKDSTRIIKSSPVNMLITSQRQRQAQVLKRLFGSSDDQETAA